MSAAVKTQMPPVAREVLRYAESAGVEPYLAAIHDLARQCFPTGEPRMFVEEDVELPGYRHIVVEVETAHLMPDELVTAQSAWSAGLFRACPAELAGHVVLGWR